MVIGDRASGRTRSRARRQAGMLTPEEMRSPAAPPPIQPQGETQSEGCPQDSVAIGPAEGHGPSRIGPLMQGLAENYGSPKVEGVGQAQKGTAGQAKGQGHGLPKVPGVDAEKGLSKVNGKTDQYKTRLTEWGGKDDHLEPVKAALGKGKKDQAIELCNQSRDKSEGIEASDAARKAGILAEAIKKDDIGDNLETWTKALKTTEGSVTQLNGAL